MPYYLPSTNVDGGGQVSSAAVLLASEDSLAVPELSHCRPEVDMRVVDSDDRVIFATLRPYTAEVAREYASRFDILDGVHG